MANIVKFVPEKRDSFLELLRMGNTITNACEAIGVSHDTVRNYRKAHPDYDDAVIDAVSGQVQMVADALWVNAMQGNVTAQIFYLVNRSRMLPERERWMNTQFVKQESTVHIDRDLPDDFVERVLHDDAAREAAFTLLERIGGSGTAESSGLGDAGKSG